MNLRPKISLEGVILRVGALQAFISQEHFLLSLSVWNLGPQHVLLSLEDSPRAIQFLVKIIFTVIPAWQLR